MDDDFKDDLESRASEIKEKEHVLYMNVGEALEAEYWHGFFAGGLLILVFTAIAWMGMRE